MEHSGIAIRLNAIVMLRYIGYLQSKRLKNAEKRQVVLLAKQKVLVMTTGKTGGLKL